MRTTNPTVLATWTLLVPDSGQNFFLSLPFDSPHRAEVVTWDSTDTPPETLQGHLLYAPKRESMNRALLGEGYVFARCLSGSTALALNAWVSSSAVLLFTAGTWATSATWLTDRTWG